MKLHSKLLVTFSFSILVAVLFFIASPVKAFAATYYVSNTSSNGYTSGSNTNNGTSKLTPWLTMIYADTHASAGDTVYVNGGTYAETYSSAYSMGFTQALTWLADGDVTVGKNDRTGGAVFVSNISGSLVVGAVGGSKFIFDSYSVANTTSVSANSSASNVTFNNATFQNATTTHMQPVVGNTNWKFDTCTFDDGPVNFYFVSSSPSLTITNSTFTSFTKKDIVYDNKASGTFTFTNNTITMNSAVTGGAAIELRNQGTDIITGNTFNVTSAAGAIIGSLSSTGGIATISNNTFNVTAGSRYVVGIISGNWLLTISNNSFTVTTSWANNFDGVVYVINQPQAATITNNTFDIQISGTCVPIAVDSTTATANGAHIITGNTITTSSDSGYVIRVGTEGSTIGDNTLQGVTVSNNTITDTIGAATIHGIIYGHSNNGIIERNSITGTADAIVIKGSQVYSLPFTSGTNAPAANATVHGSTSGATGVAGYYTLTSGAFNGTGVGTVYINQKSGTWVSGENILNSSNAVIGTLTATPTLVYEDDWSNGKVDYNIVNQPTLTGTWVKGVKNIHLYNNTYVEGASNYAQFGMIQLTSNTSLTNNPAINSVAKNNILYLTNVNSRGFNVDSVSTPGLTLDYNDLYLANNTGNYGELNGTTFYTSWNSWQALGYDTHSISTNPLFVSTSDYRLQSISPDINVGINVGLTSDILGNSISGNPDIGAYEFQPVASTSSTSSLSSSSSSTTADPNHHPGWSYTVLAGPHYIGAVSFIRGSMGADNAYTFISPSATNEDVYVTINRSTPQELLAATTPIPFPWQEGINTAGEIYHFTALAAFNGYPIVSFVQPVTIIIPYDPSRLYGRSPQALQIATYNPHVGKWQWITTPTVSNPLQHTLATTVEQFSYFTVGYSR